MTFKAKAADMNQSFKGAINTYFQPFNSAINRSIVKRAVEESKSQVPHTNEELEANIAYASSISCKK